MALGIAGIVICALIISGLVIACIWTIPILISIGQYVDYPALLIVSAGLVFGGIFMLVLFGMILSSMFVDRKPEKRSVGILTSLVAALILLTGAACTGTAWVTLTGKNGVDRVIEVVNDRVSIDINEENGSSVQVDLSPLRIKINAE